MTTLTENFDFLCAPHSSSGNNRPVNCMLVEQDISTRCLKHQCIENISIYVKGTIMSVASQLAMAFIVFGAVAVIGIGFLVVQIGKQQEDIDATTARNRDSSF